MSYIVVLNAQILSGKDSVAAVLDPDKLGLVSQTTALIAGVITILMGIVANVPIAVAAALGLNSFVAACVSTVPGARWEFVMGLVTVEGLLILILALTGLRKLVFDIIPQSFRIAIGVGIGLFITLVGLWDSGFISKGSGTPLQLDGNGSITRIPTLVFILCLFSMVVLHIKRVPGGILLTIIAGTVISVVVEKFLQLGSIQGNAHGWMSNVPNFSGKVLSIPNFSLVGRVDILGAFEYMGALTSVLLILALFLSDFFDTMGTMIAVASEGDLLDKNHNPVNAQRTLVVDSLGAIFGGFCSVSSNSTYIESSTGVAAGARTGLASVTTGFLFLVATFLAPLTTSVPAEVTSAALVFVGLLMISSVTKIDWGNLVESFPAFMVIIITPFAYSIANGIGAGFITMVITKLFCGKAKEIHPLIWGVGITFLVYFARTVVL
jgi:AGZA family xanthine/uracil permease-like MFS transporter